MSIKNIIAGSTSAASRYFFFLVALTGMFCMASCSDSDATEGEFDNWKERNEAYFSSIYTKAESAIQSGSKEWKIIRVYSKDPSLLTSKNDDIVVHVETEGTGTESPLFTDTVRVHYKGNLMPSASYANGYQFDASWVGNYNIKTMVPKAFQTGNLVAGFTTALMNMHKGDHWTVYMPYTLGYGATGSSTSSSSIPGYSTLIFDITLSDFIHPGEKFKAFQ